MNTCCTEEAGEPLARSLAELGVAGDNGDGIDSPLSPVFSAPARFLARPSQFNRML